MTTEANKALVRRFFGEIDQGHLDIIDEVCASDFVCHMANGLSPQPLSRDEYKQFMAGATAAFSEMRHEIKRLVSEGDIVVWHITDHLKHTGDFQGIAPTGKSISFDGIGIGRVRDGQLMEMWVEADFLGLMQQLGAVPEVTTAS